MVEVETIRMRRGQIKWSSMGLWGWKVVKVLEMRDADGPVMVLGGSLLRRGASVTNHVTSPSRPQGSN
jgi:hypothetical protein